MVSGPIPIFLAPSITRYFPYSHLAPANLRGTPGGGIPGSHSTHTHCCRTVQLGTGCVTDIFQGSGPPPSNNPTSPTRSSPRWFKTDGQSNAWLRLVLRLRFSLVSLFLSRLLVSLDCSPYWPNRCFRVCLLHSRLRSYAFSYDMTTFLLT